MRYNTCSFNCALDSHLSVNSGVSGLDKIIQHVKFDRLKIMIRMGGLMYISVLGLKISIWKLCLIMKTITRFALPFYVEYGMSEKLPFALKSQFFVLIIYLFCVSLMIRLVHR